MVVVEWGGGGGQICAYVYMRGKNFFCFITLDSQMHSQGPDNNKLLQKTLSLDSLEHSGEGDMPLQNLLVTISDP